MIYPHRRSGMRLSIPNSPGPSSAGHWPSWTPSPRMEQSSHWGTDNTNSDVNGQLVDHSESPAVSINHDIDNIRRHQDRDAAKLFDQKRSGVKTTHSNKITLAPLERKRRELRVHETMTQDADWAALTLFRKENHASVVGQMMSQLRHMPTAEELTRKMFELWRLASPEVV